MSVIDIIRNKDIREYIPELVRFSDNTYRVAAQFIMVLIIRVLQCSLIIDSIVLVVVSQATLLTM